MRVRMLIRCAVLGILPALLIVGYPVSQSDALRHGDPAVRVVGTDVVNIRSVPKTGQNTLLTRLPRGTLLKRVRKQGDWYEVLLPDGRQAWIYGRYAQEETARDLLEVRGRGVRVRQSPTTGSVILARVKQGEMMSLVEERNTWYRVVLPDDRRGWVHRDLVIRRPLVSAEPEPVAPAAQRKTRESPEPSEPPEPVSPEAVKPPAGQLYRQGKAFAAEGRTEEAIDAFTEALRTRPNDGAIHFDLGRLLKQKRDLEAALDHFRKALAAGNRDEAKYYIDEILKSQSAASEASDVDADIEDPAMAEGLSDASDVGAYLLPGVTIGSLVFLVVLGVVFFRRRQVSRMDQPVYRRRNRDDGFDSVLKYAVEKRPLLRSIEEAERKRSEMDEALKQRFDRFGEGGGPRLPPGESSEALLKRVEDIRQTILNQEERAQIYADLVLLQNQKLDALDEEIAALKKLIQIDYQDTGKKRNKDQK